MVCPNCKKEVERLTKDHIIPQQLCRRLPHMFKCARKITIRNKGNIRMICDRCNSDKSNRIWWEHPYVREYMKNISDEIVKNLSETEEDRSLETNLPTPPMQGDNEKQA